MEWEGMVRQKHSLAAGLSAILSLPKHGQSEGELLPQTVMIYVFPSFHKDRTFINQSEIVTNAATLQCGNSDATAAQEGKCLPQNYGQKKNVSL